MVERRTGGPEPTERALVELGRAITFPPTPEFAPRVRARIEERRGGARPAPGALWPVARRTRWLWATVALLAALAVLLALPRTREAVAELFGLRGVRFTEVPVARPGSEDDPASATASGVPPVPGERVTLEEARVRVDFPVLVPTALGLPDAVLAGTPPRAGHLTLLYERRIGLPEPLTQGVALALTQFRGDAEPFITKSIPPGARLEPVLVGGARGFWLEGAHPVMFQDAAGVVRTDAPRLAGNTLLWQRGGITYRLESGLGRDDAIRIAESLR